MVLIWILNKTNIQKNATCKNYKKIIIAFSSRTKCKLNF